MVVMSETASGVRRWREGSKSKGKRKSKTDAETDRLRPATSISKTSKTSSILESLISTEVKEEEEDVPFLPALALPDSPGGWRDSPTPPPSRPSSTLPPLPELGMASPKKVRSQISDNFLFLIFKMIPMQIIPTKLNPSKNETSGGSQEDHRPR